MQQASANSWLLSLIPKWLHLDTLGSRVTNVKHFFCDLGMRPNNQLFLKAILNYLQRPNHQLVEPQRVVTSIW